MFRVCARVGQNDQQTKHEQESNLSAFSAAYIPNLSLPKLQNRIMRGTETKIANLAGHESSKAWAGGIARPSQRKTQAHFLAFSTWSVWRLSALIRDWRR